MAEYIERESAMLLPELPKEYRHYQTDNLDDAYEQGWDDALCCLEHIPAADVAPVRHGRWEPYFEEVEIYNAGGVAERKQTGWICGRCKSVKSITRYYKTNYCPNCGAKMDLEALQ